MKRNLNKHLAKFLAFSMALSLLPTMAFATYEQEPATEGAVSLDANSWSLSGGEITTYNDETVLKITEDLTSGNNRYEFDAPIIGDILTVEFDVLTEGVATYKGGLKLLNGGTSNTYEFSRLKFDSDRLRMLTEATSTYTSVVEGSLVDDTWNNVKLVYEVNEAGNIVTDVFYNDEQVGEDMANGFDLATPADGTITVTHLNFFTDSKGEIDTAYYKNISVTAEDETDEETGETKITGLEDNADIWTLATGYGTLIANEDDETDTVLSVNSNTTDVKATVNRAEYAVLSDVITLSFDIKTDGISALKGGYKLYTDGISSTNEFSRFKFETGSLKFQESSYTNLGSTSDGDWNNVVVVYSIIDDAVVSDVYFNQEKLNEEPLINPLNGGIGVVDGNIKFDYINFFTDSTSGEGTYYYNNIEVKEGAFVPEAPEEEEEEEGPPTEAVKPPHSADVPSLQEPVAYPESNIYGSGLNGHEIIAPEVVANAKTIDVTSFNAIPDDGIDDTYAINNAIAMANYGDTVYFPAGQYDFITSASPVITLKDGVSLVGENEETTILKVENTSSVAQVMFMRGTGVTNLTISDMTLTSMFYGDYPEIEVASLANNPERNGEMTHGIYLDRSNDQPSEFIVIEDVTVEVFKTMAIALRNTNNVRVTGCTLQYATDMGGGGAGYGITVQGIASTDSFGQPYDSMHNLIEENEVIGENIRHGILLQYYTHNNLVINNMIYGTGYGAIDLHGEDEYLNEIAYNVIDNTWNGGAIEIGNSGAGHDLAGPLNYVHHNEVSNGRRGIDVEFGTPDTIVEFNEITGNTVEAVSSGIRLRNSERTIVRNNEISQSNYGIHLDTDKGYSYDGDSAWGAGVPVMADIYDNTLSSNGDDYVISAGVSNTIDGYTADDSVVVSESANAHLVALVLGNEEFVRPFLPYTENHVVYLYNDSLTLTPYTSARAYESITINGENANSDEEFTVSGLALGENNIEIVVVSEDGINEMTYTVKAVRLDSGEEKPVLVQAVNLIGSAPVVPVNWNYTLNATVSPSNATNQGITMEVITGEDIISIDENGVITPIKEGVATVRISSDENSSIYTDVIVTIIGSLPLVEVAEGSSKLDVIGVTDSSNDGNLPSYAIDGDMSTRWASAVSVSDGEVITTSDIILELDDVYEITNVKAAWNKGDERQAEFSLFASLDGENWTEIYDGRSTGLMSLLETYIIEEPTEAKYIKLEGRGCYENNTNNWKTNWISIFEIEVYGKEITVNEGVVTRPIPDDSDDNSSGDTQIEDGETPLAEGVTTLFNDIQDHWAKDEIDYIVEKNIMKGISETEFAPNDLATRAMIWTILYRLDGNTDETGDNWYDKAMAWAVENEVSDGTNPQENITREQLVTMIWRYYGSEAPKYDVDITFADWDKVSDYAKNAMMWAYENGIITGKTENTINPDESATRAEISAILKRILDK